MNNFCENLEKRLMIWLKRVEYFDAFLYGNVNCLPIEYNLLFVI